MVADPPLQSRLKIRMDVWKNVNKKFLKNPMSIPKQYIIIKKYVSNYERKNLNIKSGYLNFTKFLGKI